MRIDRIVVLAVIIAITQGFLLAVDPTSGPFSKAVSESFQLPLTALLLASLAIITAGIADATVRSHPQIYLLKLPTIKIQGRRFEFAPFSWILPALLVIGNYLFLRLFDSTIVQLIGTVISSLILLIVIVAQYYTVGRQEKYYGWANIGLNIATYIAGFLLFSAIYVNKWRALQSATLVAIITFLLTYDLLRQTKSPGRQLVTYSVLMALVLGQVTWALNYWLLPVLVGGVMLIFIFYVFVGILQAYLTGNLNRSVLREYFFISVLVGLLIVYSIVTNPQTIAT